VTIGLEIKNGNTGTGIVGTSLDDTGVLGDSAGGAGVAGHSSDRGGSSGIVGSADNGIGVEGHGREGGVWGDSQSTRSAGVSGSNGQGGAGVFGTADGGTGVQGQANGDMATGVWGQSDTGTGVAAQTDTGVALYAKSKGGIAVYAEATGTSAIVATTAYEAGLLANVRDGATGVVANTDSGWGVWGTSGSGHGVVGQSSSGFGVLALSDGRSPALVAQAVIGASVPIAQFDGDVCINGSIVCTQNKNAVVKAPDGSHRALYCVESPESWFEDFGRARLVRGKAHVRLDLIFAAVVRAGDYHVFLAPEGDCHNLFVSRRTRTGFEVREQQHGTSTVPFSYRIVARRKDVDAPRFKRTTIPALPKVGLPPAPRVPALSKRLRAPAPSKLAARLALSARRRQSVRRRGRRPRAAGSRSR
jgi:hypothetical protein